MVEFRYEVLFVYVLIVLSHFGDFMKVTEILLIFNLVFMVFFEFYDRAISHMWEFLQRFCWKFYWNFFNAILMFDV